MSHLDVESQEKNVHISDLKLDSETYRAMSKLAYSGGMSVEAVISDLLKKQLAMQGFLRNGFELFHKDIVRTLANAIPDEKLVQEARGFPSLAKELVILNVDGIKPDLKKYIKAFASFMHVNDYAVSISENMEGTISFYVRHNINYKYSLYWGEIIKMTLENLAEVINVEIGDTSLYLECKVLPEK